MRLFYLTILKIYDIIFVESEGKMKSQIKRKYYRHCGCCGKRDEQSNMHRSNKVSNGWLCEDCYQEDLLFDLNTNDPIGWDDNEF